MKFALLCLSLFVFNSSSFANDDFKSYKHPLYESFQEATGPQLASFASVELKELTQNTKAVFYPFGGPDIVYPIKLFPHANSYLLVGLEPRGKNKKNLKLPKNLDAQIDSLLRRSFFVTSNMGKIISHNDGVLPLFLGQISTLGGEVIDVKYSSHSFGNSLEINFKYLGTDKKLTYVRTNLEDKSLSDEFLKFVKENNLFDTCMLKASSYSLHRDNFSKMRNFITENANLVLQDDSGIPIKYLSKDFKLHLFGNYLKPYGVEWKGYFQKDLFNVYQNEASKTEIPFCFGYGCRKNPVAIIVAARNIADIPK